MYSAKISTHFTKGVIYTIIHRLTGVVLVM